MEDDDKKLEGQEGNESDAGNDDGAKKPEGQEGGQGAQAGKDDGATKDSHGQPGINKERHDREMAEKDKKIADLEAQLEEKAKTEEGRAELKQQLEEARASIADMKVNHSLEMLGCKNVKAAKALLEDYDNDPAKLKEAAPYLFGEEGEQKPQGSTGKKPTGAADSSLDEKLDKAFGLKK